MTISPPSNVKLAPEEAARVLASGIDSLVLTAQVEWKNDRAFRLLEYLKREAKKSGDDEPVRLEVSSWVEDFLFDVKPFGAEGYEWILYSRSMSLRIGYWAIPKQRPSVIVTFSAEALWSIGPSNMVDRFLDLFEVLGGTVIEVKASRIDPCIDILIRAEEMHRTLDNNFVTRADYIDPHTYRRRTTGFSIGRGAVHARLYDKALEIAVKSGKTWMYRIWGINAVPDGHVILRVEFQFRREALKRRGINFWSDAAENLPSIWKYAASDWLRLVDDPRKHHTQQELLSWWEVVANGFPGAQDAKPLVANDAISFEMKRYAQSVMGGITSIAALLAGTRKLEPQNPWTKDIAIGEVLDYVFDSMPMSSEEFRVRVVKKAGTARAAPIRLQERYWRSVIQFVSLCSGWRA